MEIITWSRARKPRIDGLARLGLTQLYAGLAATEAIIELPGFPSHLVRHLDEDLYMLIEDVQRSQLRFLILV